MKQTKTLMGMPITVEIIGVETPEDFDIVYAYFKAVDARYSVYKPNSEISLINKGLPKEKWSHEMTLVLDLCEQTKQLTNGYFDISYKGQYDPSGLVKGWAIRNAVELLQGRGKHNFYIEAGGDIQMHGKNADNELW